MNGLRYDREPWIGDVIRVWDLRGAVRYVERMGQCVHYEKHPAGYMRTIWGGIPYEWLTGVSTGDCEAPGVLVVAVPLGRGAVSGMGEHRLAIDITPFLMIDAS